MCESARSRVRGFAPRGLIVTAPCGRYPRDSPGSGKKLAVRTKQMKSERLPGSFPGVRRSVQSHTGSRTIQRSRHEHAVAGLRWAGQIVIDATNAVRIPSLEPVPLGGRTSSEIVAELVPGAWLVKAANTLGANVLAADPADHGGRRVLFVSGDINPTRTRSPTCSTARASSRSTSVTSWPAGASKKPDGHWPGRTWCISRSSDEEDSESRRVTPIEAAIPVVSSTVSRAFP